VLRDFDKVIYTPVMKTTSWPHHHVAEAIGGILHKADRGGQLHNFNHVFVGRKPQRSTCPSSLT